jgi:CHASE3 domain sensor protein
MTNELTEELARKSEEIEKLTYDLKKASAYTDDLERKIQELSTCVGK